jgi:hypothetical protein
MPPLDTVLRYLDHDDPNRLRRGERQIREAISALKAGRPSR